MVEGNIDEEEDAIINVVGDLVVEEEEVRSKSASRWVNCQQM